MESRRRWKVSCIFFFKAARKGKYIWIERRVSTCGKRSAFLCCFARQNTVECVVTISRRKGERRFCLRVGWWVGPFSLWVSPSKTKGSRLSKSLFYLILGKGKEGEEEGLNINGVRTEGGGWGGICLLSTYSSAESDTSRRRTLTLVSTPPPPAPAEPPPRSTLAQPPTGASR